MNGKLVLQCITVNIFLGKFKDVNYLNSSGFICSCTACKPWLLVVSRSQITVSSFIFGREEKGSGNLTLEFPYYKISRIWDC